MSGDDRRQLLLEALAEAFHPDDPVVPAQFKGREEQAQALLNAVRQPGAHVVLFGERGLGKTSLAEVVQRTLERSACRVVRATAETTSTFEALWQRLLSGLVYRTERPAVGFGSRAPESVTVPLIEAGVPLTSAASVCDLLGDAGPVVAIIDEFDMLPSVENARFATLIKYASDQRVDLTMVLVGVAEDISKLLHGHKSVERCLHQVQMPRMSAAELRQIIEDGWLQCGFTFDNATLDTTVARCHGFPYLAQLLGQCCGYEAVNHATMNIDQNRVRAGVTRALDKMRYTVAIAYEAACARVGDKKIHQLASATVDQYGLFKANLDADAIAKLVASGVLKQDVLTGAVRFEQPLLQAYAQMRESHGRK